MKPPIKTFTIALLTLMAITLDAQSGTQFITITVTGNSNAPAQAPASIVIALDEMGNDSLGVADSGDLSSLGAYSAEVFPFTISADSNRITGVDTRPALNGYRTIPVGFISNSPARINIVAELTTSDPHTPLPGFVWLEQRSTGKRYSILDTAEFDITANPNFESDFVLHVGPSTGSTSIGETCNGNTGGTIFVKGPGADHFTYQLTKGPILVYSGVIAGFDTTFQHVAAGRYLGVISVNGIPVDSSEMMVAVSTMLVADFATDSGSVAPGDVINFSDNSVGGVFYEWRFGNGDSSTVAGSESHSYTDPGEYIVSLTISDTNGCFSMAYDIVTVAAPDIPGHINQLNNSSVHSSFETGGSNNGNASAETVAGNHHSYSSDGRIVVAFEQPQTSRVTITSMNGTVISSGIQSGTGSQYEVPCTGIYIVTIEHTNGAVTSETVLVQ